MRRCFQFSALIFALAGPASAKSEDGISWEGWSDSIFERAQRQNRFVLLDLEAIWCHWCHVMDQTTYRDPKVARLIRSHYLAVRVDQDSNPALSDRYEDWGWPATIVFAPNGTEIVKRRGYIPPKGMAAMLEAIIRDPSPGPSVAAEADVEASPSSSLTKAQQQAIRQRFVAAYDEKYGGWGQIHKLIDAEPLELAMAEARGGDSKAEAMAKKTLDAALKLIDPVWGGVYQYSDSLDWSSPHFEKIISIQAQSIRMYSLGYKLFKEPRYLEAAKRVYSYLITFLTSAEGVFYTSQDADLSEKVDGHAYFKRSDAERRKLGIPHVDTHVYARENGWAIDALTALYDVTGDPEIIDRARKAAHWIGEKRSVPGGGFKHGEGANPPALGDTLAMGRAFLSLYACTGEREWLKRSEAAAQFIDDTFGDRKAPGYFSVAPTRDAKGVFQRSVKHIGDNTDLVRFANLLFRYTGNPKWEAQAKSALRYLAPRAGGDTRRLFAGTLLADLELSNEPVHITVVGPKDDVAAHALHLAARAYPAVYARTDWWDRREGPLPNLSIQFPETSRSAAFACSGTTCSLPVTDPSRVATALDRLRNAKKPD